MELTVGQSKAVNPLPVTLQLNVTTSPGHVQSLGNFMSCPDPTPATVYKLNFYPTTNCNWQNTPVISAVMRRVSSTIVTLEQKELVDAQHEPIMDHVTGEHLPRAGNESLSRVWYWSSISMPEEASRKQKLRN